MSVAMDRITEKEPPSEEIPSSDPPKSFDPRQQAVKLLFKFLGRWLLTAGICGAFALVLERYSRRPWMDDDSTHIYNAVVSGLTICLSLNIDASLNAFAAALKWVIASAKKFNPRVFEAILAFDSSKVNAIKLLFWRRVGAWWLRLICVLWLLIALAAQVGSALIGLTYSVIPLSADKTEFPRTTGDGRTAIFTQIGYYGEPVASDQEGNLTTQRSNAFDYGVGGINAGGNFLDSPSPFAFHATTYDRDAQVYVNAISNYPSWASNSLTLWNVIERAVNNSAQCQERKPIQVNTGSNMTDVTFDGYNGTQAFGIPQSPVDYVTYISDTSFSCGSRCTQVYVLFSAGDTAALFTCNSTVSEMFENNENFDIVNRTDLSMPDTQARILAGAIGWGNIDIDGYLDGQSMPGRFQASSFPNGSFWAPEWSTVITDGVVNTDFVQLFTASAVVVMNQYGIQKNFSDITIPGMASELDVTWKYSILILALIPGIQAILAFICVLVVYLRGVPIHEDSPLAIARLLSPALSRITTSAGTVETDLKYMQMKETDEGSHEGKWVIGMIDRK